MEALGEFVLAMGGSPWALVAVFVLTIVDAVFPLVPSESVVIGLAAIAVGTGRPSLAVLAIVAAAAAWLGDQLAYEIGRAVGLTRWRWMHRPWFVRSRERATRAMAHRVSTAVLAGRFVPGGRVVVSLVAGATRVPRRIYRPLSALAASLWAGYAVAVGSVGGPWVADHPVLGVGLSIALGVAAGLLLDRSLTWLLARRAAALAQPQPSAAGGEPDPLPAGASTRSSSISASKSSTDSY